MENRKPKWVVEHHFLYGWDDAGWEHFETRQLAQAAVDELIQDTIEAAQEGRLAAPYKRRDYRVTPEK